MEPIILNGRVFSLHDQHILLHFEGNGKSHGWLIGDIYAGGGEGGVCVCLSADCHKIMRMRPRVAPFCLMKDSLSPPVDSRALPTRNATNKLVGMAQLRKVMWRLLMAY